MLFFILFLKKKDKKYNGKKKKYFFWRPNTYNVSNGDISIRPFIGGNYANMVRSKNIIFRIKVFYNQQKNIFFLVVYSLVLN